MKKILIVVLSLILAYASTTTALASEKAEMESAPRENDQEILDYMEANDLVDFEKEAEIIIPNKIYKSEKEAGKLPGVTTGFYLGEDNLIVPMATGEGYVIGRVRSWMTASDGYIRTGYKKGTLSAIGSIVLSFIPGVNVSVAAILGIVSLAASMSDTVSGETLITYRYQYRDGEGRWSTDPNQSGYWHLGFRTGQRETFKHVIGGKLNKSTQKWTYEMKNYTAPIRTEKTPNYTKSDAWLAEQGRQYVTVGWNLIETNW